LVESQAESITLDLFETTLDGSEIIIQYELYMNEGATSTTYNQITTYDGHSAQHTLTTVDDLIVPGTIYKFKTRAVNAYGNSDYSEELNAGFGALPAKPLQVTRLLSESSDRHVTLEWTTSPDTDIPVIGYRLRMNDGVGGSTYNNITGVLFPNVRKYVVGNLTTGLEYGFTVEALNFNGAGDSSNPAFFIVCTAPRELATAEMTGVTRNTVTLTWLAPNITGGCPVTSYSIF
jgi:hypothetical protein